MTTLAQDLGGVVRLLEKATPGVWNHYESKYDGDVYMVQAAPPKMHVLCRYNGDGDGYTQQDVDNAAAIAACVNFLRAHSAEIAGALEQLRDLHDSIRTVYDAVPALPITADTMDAATDALHAFCLLVGIHRVDVGDPQPQPAMQQGCGGGE